MEVGWKNDYDLAEDMKNYVCQNIKRAEMLDFLQRDYTSYKWSLPTLDRRMRHFGIHYIDETVDVEDVQCAIRAELDGPGQLLGYRAMSQKLRVHHDIKVPRHLVNNILSDIDPEGVAKRSLQKKRKREKTHFTSKGSMWVVSVDGHDKLCGYQNWTFPLGVYGFIDTFSRKILALSVVVSNSDPLVIGQLYTELLHKMKMAPRFLRMDKGTETGKMATIHTYLMSQNDIFEDPLDSIAYGPSTSNKIERWWRDLHERLEKFFKTQLKELLQEQEYDPHNYLHRKIMAYVYVPIMQRECNIFVDMWNNHRIRGQKDLELPTGIPNHMFSFPERYGAESMGIPILNEQLVEVAELSGIEAAQSEFIEDELKQALRAKIPNPEKIQSKDAKNSYLFLKHNLFT